jgi:hypothetical protein
MASLAAPGAVALPAPPAHAAPALLAHAAPALPAHAVPALLAHAAPSLLAQSSGEVQADEIVADLSGGGVGLYLDVPFNMLVFVEHGEHNSVPIGPMELTGLQAAYMHACERALGLAPEARDSPESLSLGEYQLQFAAVRADRRCWVVISVSGPEGVTTRLSVPQAWDLKDPQMEQLYAVKSGFERLLIKAGML